MMEDDIVNHFEGNDQKRQHKRHGKRRAGNLGTDAVSLDALTFLFGELLHRVLDSHRFSGAKRTRS